MKKLLKAYTSLEKIYERLDNLIRVALFKAVRSGDEWGSGEQRVMHQHEDEYDSIAYSDAVNRRFEFYYKAVCKFLELFFQEQHGVSIRNTRELFNLCYQKKLIDEKELRDCLSLIDYMRTIRRPCNKIGDSMLTEQLLCYAVTMNDLSTRLAAQVKCLPFDVLKKQEPACVARSVIRI